MSKQAYFAVVVNTDGSMYIDYDMPINFDQDIIWNEKTEKWESEYDNSNFYESASEGLTDLINSTKLNINTTEENNEQATN